MENNEMMSIATTEAAVEVAEQVATVPAKDHSGLKNAAIVGGIMTLGAITWEFGVKPIGRKLKGAWAGRKEKQKAKKAEAKSVVEQQDIIEDVEDEFSID